jgi:hypothetical protein
LSTPKELIVNYEDGTQKTFDYHSLETDLQLRIAKLGLSPLPQEIGSSRNYIILQWKDGWQEVIGSEKATVDLLRYFVIRRIEDRGRFAFEVGAEYPELLVIRRLPMDLKRVLIVSEGRVKSYDLGKEVARHEGTFEAGGKLEYVKYDKVEDKYPSEMSEGAENLDETIGALKEAMEKKGISASDVLEMNQSQRIEKYKEITEGMGIRGHQKQADVYGFIELLVKRIGKN